MFVSKFKTVTMPFPSFSLIPLFVSLCGLLYNAAQVEGRRNSEFELHEASQLRFADICNISQFEERNSIYNITFLCKEEI